MVAALQNQKAIIAKTGMDAHWRGAIVVAHALREAGMEVIYLGHVTATELAAAVTQEDPVLVGLSTLSGNHLTTVPEVMTALRATNTRAIVVVGGAIPASDVGPLLDAGVASIFPTGASLADIIEQIEVLVRETTTPADKNGAGV